MTGPTGFASRLLDVPDDIEELYDALTRDGMTDGLPVIPPTPARVERMVAASGLPAATEVATLPPRGGVATIEKLAINAVMAGCRPEYFPVVIAAVEAMAQPQYNLLGVQSTTNPVAPFLLVNGPVRTRIGLNCGRGVFGPGNRANATIGRAIRLILLNVGGGIPGDVDKSIHGSPGKYGMCIGENEEDSPWTPFHVERGYTADDSTVTALSVQGTQSVAASYRDPEHVLRMVLNAMAVWGSNSYSKGAGCPVVIFSPGHARLFADAGWTRAELRETLFERTRVPLAQFPKEPRLMDTSARRHIVDGHVYITASADDIVIAVAGGPEPYHVTVLASYGEPLAMACIRS
jgi:hypothetical protein